MFIVNLTGDLVSSQAGYLSCFTSSPMLCRAKKYVDDRRGVIFTSRTQKEGNHHSEIYA